MGTASGQYGGKTTAAAELLAMKARCRAMASSLLVDFHLGDHLEQIRAVVNAIRG